MHYRKVPGLVAGAAGGPIGERRPGRVTDHGPLRRLRQEPAFPEGSASSCSATAAPESPTGLGIAACEQGRRVRYVTCAQLVNELVEAADERRLSRVAREPPER